MLVDEYCMRNGSLGLVYLDPSSLLSTFIWLKYHKNTHLLNNSACSVQTIILYNSDSSGGQVNEKCKLC